MSAPLTRLLKPLLRLLPLGHSRRRLHTTQEERPAPPPAVLGVGAGSVGFPYEESGK